MKQWPWPDTTLERFKRTAQIYRHRLEQLAPQDCAALDAQMVAHGQTWVIATASAHEPTDLLTAELAADEMHVARRTIYAWRARGLPVIHTPDGPRYRVDDLRRFVADQRRRRTRQDT